MQMEMSQEMVGNVTVQFYLTDDSVYLHIHGGKLLGDFAIQADIEDDGNVNVFDMSDGIDIIQKFEGY